VGADTTHRLGSVFGEESTFLTQSQMPAHSHTALGGNTGDTGGGDTVNNDQPSLALNYLIATSGVYPSSSSGAGFDSETPVLGQIVEFAGTFAPGGWALANGQLLSIASNSALFSLLGTTYGGDGRTTFALPDFRGRTMIGSGDDFDVGDRFGTNFNTLSVANLAAHDHTFTAAIPEPETYAMLLAGLGLLGWHARRRKHREAL